MAANLNEKTQGMYPTLFKTKKTTCAWYINRYNENAASIFLTNQGNKFKILNNLLNNFWITYFRIDSYWSCSADLYEKQSECILPSLKRKKNVCDWYIKGFKGNTKSTFLTKQTKKS